MHRALPLVFAAVLSGGCVHHAKPPAPLPSLAERPPTGMMAIREMQIRDAAIASLRSGQYADRKEAFRQAEKQAVAADGEYAAWQAQYAKAVRAKAEQDKFRAKLDATVAAMKKDGAW